MNGAASISVPYTRTENGYPVNRHFRDVPQDAPEVRAEPGFEDEVVTFSLFAYLSRSDVTWNPSIVSVCKASLYCPTTEEYILPIIHGNDRVEWFVQLSDEIMWDVSDRETGRPRARVLMKSGDVAAMPADIRHQGYSKKRSMLLVWENATADLPKRYEMSDRIRAAAGIQDPAQQQAQAQSQQQANAAQQVMQQKMAVLAAAEQAARIRKLNAEAQRISNPAPNY